jgi:hypothetical protein
MLARLVQGTQSGTLRYGHSRFARSLLQTCRRWLSWSAGGSRSSLPESNRATSFASKCYAFFRPIALVLVFGIARFLTVKGVNYQV